jgi:hypothetical protein
MRIGNRVGATLLGVALVVVGLVAAADVAWVTAGNPPWPPWLRQWLIGWRETTVGDPQVFWTGVVLAGIGLLLLVPQLRRWRPDRLPADLPATGGKRDDETPPDTDTPYGVETPPDAGTTVDTATTWETATPPEDATTPGAGAPPDSELPADSELPLDSELPPDGEPPPQAATAGPDVWWLTRRGVERRVAATANSVVGVHGARAEITRGLRRWRVRVRATADPAETATVRRALRRELARIGLPPQVPVEVHLHQSRRVT